MERLFKFVAIAVVTLLSVSMEAHGESLARTCRRICQDEIQACVDGGESRASCRRTVLGQCRTTGVSLCLDAGESARKAAATSLISPTVLSATATTPNLVVLAWDDTNDQEQGYSVERGMDGVTFTEIVQTLANATAYSDPGRLANTTYFYRVRAFRVRRGRYTFSAYSTVARVTTPANGVAPTTTTTTVPTTSSTSTTSTSSSTSTSTSSSSSSTAPPTTSTSTTLVPTTTTVPATTSTSSSSTSSTSTSSSSSSSSSTSTSSSSSSSSTSTSSTSSSSSTSTSRPTTTSTSSSSTTSTSTSTSSTSTTAVNQPPHASAGPDQATQTLLTISFNGSGSTDPDGTIVTYAWNFGDGGSGSGAVSSHAYASAGTYTATLTVTDNRGGTNTDSASVSVANRPPTAMAGPDRTAAPGGAVAFDGSASSDADGSIRTYAWAFGDGATASGIAMNHAYATAGVYSAMLTVTDDLGAVSSDVATVTVGGAATAWTKGFSSTGSDAAYAVAVDAAGNTVVGGAYRGAMPIGTVTTLANAGNADMFLVKYAPDGTVLWARGFGSTGDESLLGVAIDPLTGNVVATGWFTAALTLGGTTLTPSGPQDMLLAKFDGATGAPVWAKQFGGVYEDSGAGVAVDGGGNIVLTGFFKGYCSFGGATLRTAQITDPDVFLAKFTSAGAHLWSERFTNGAGDWGNGVAVDASGNIALVGAFTGSLNLGGTALFAAGGFSDGFVARFDAAGTHTWSRKIGAGTPVDGTDTANAVAMDSSGNVVVTGTVSGAIDFGGGVLSSIGQFDGFAAMYAATTGTHVWSRTLGGIYDDYGYGIAVDGSNNVVVTGAFTGTANFGGATNLVAPGTFTTNAFVAKYTQTGAFQWARGFGGSSDDSGRAIAAAPTGHVAVAGIFREYVVFDGVGLTNAGLGDGFLYHGAP